MAHCSPPASVGSAPRWERCSVRALGSKGGSGYLSREHGSLLAQLQPWSQQQRGLGRSTSPTRATSREVRALKSLSSNIILEVRKQQKEADTTPSAPPELYQSFEWSWCNPWHLSGQTGPNQQLLSCLPHYLQRELQSLSGRCRRAAQSPAAVLGSRVLPELPDPGGKRCWPHGRAARPWQHFSWFVALGEEKHSEINISGF